MLLDLAFQVSERSSVRIAATSAVEKRRTRASRRSAEKEEEGEEDAEGEDEVDAEGEEEERLAKEKARGSSIATAPVPKRGAAQRGRVKWRGSGRSQTVVSSAMSTPELAASASGAKQTTARGRGAGRARGGGRLKAMGRGGMTPKGKGRDAISETSSVSMGEWASNSGEAPESGSVVDAPTLKKTRRGALSRVAGRFSKLKDLKDSDSSLTELTEESVSLGGYGGGEGTVSPSLGGVASLASSPSLGGTKPLSGSTTRSKRLSTIMQESRRLTHTSARSDGGITHVSESIEDGTHVSETTGEGTDVDVEGVSNVVGVRDFEYESGSEKQKLGRGQARRVVEVVVPRRDVDDGVGSSHRIGESSSAPHRMRSSSVSHLVGSALKSHRVAPTGMEILRLVSPVKASGSRSHGPVFVLLQGGNEYREAEAYAVRARFTREEYGSEPLSGEEEEEERWERDAKGKGKGKGKQRGEPPSKRMRVDADEEGGRGARRASSSAKGKGKAVDREFFAWFCPSNWGSRVRRLRSWVCGGQRV